MRDPASLYRPWWYPTWSQGPTPRGAYRRRAGSGVLAGYAGSPAAARTTHVLPGRWARPRAAPSGAARGRACSPGFAGLACRGAGFAGAAAGGRLSQILRYAGFSALPCQTATSNRPGTAVHACPCTRTPTPRGRLTARFVWRKFWARDWRGAGFVGNWASPTKDPFQSSPGGRKSEIGHSFGWALY